MESLEDAIAELPTLADLEWLTADAEFERLLFDMEDTRNARKLIDVALAMLAARRN